VRPATAHVAAGGQDGTNAGTAIEVDPPGGEEDPMLRLLAAALVYLILKPSLLRLLIVVTAFWSLTSSGATPSDVLELAEWASDHVQITVR
jgi:hypothetical protein